MSTVELKSRAKRILTFQLPASAQSPRFPVQRVELRRSKIVKHQAAPVAHDVQAVLPPALTILPGEVVKVPKSFLDLGPLSQALRARELIVLREIAPPKSKPPAPPKAAPLPKAEAKEPEPEPEAEKPEPKFTTKKPSAKGRK